MEENKNTENKNTENINAGQNIGGTSTQTAKASNFTEENKSSDSQNINALSERKTDSNDESNSLKGLYDKAKESGGEVLNQAKEKASSALGEQKSTLATGIGNVADSIRQVGGNLREGDEKNSIVGLTAQYGDSLAQQLEKFSNYLDRREVKDMVRDVESFARRNPAVFLGAAFALGFLAVRFLKTSRPGQSTERNVRNRSGNKGSMGINKEAPAY